MPGKTVAEKMFMKPGHRVAALNVPADDAALVGALPEGVKLAKKAGKDTDFVHLFVRTRADLARDLPRVLEAIAPETVLWVSYPKKTSGVETDISRDQGWEPMTGAGWEAVTQIAVDEVWSALRFKPSGAIEVRAGKAAPAKADGAPRKMGHAAGTRAEKKAPAPRGAAPAAVKVPADLAAALAAAPEAKARFAKLPPSHRREYVTWIEEAKREATRAKRIAEAVKKIVATA